MSHTNAAALRTTYWVFQIGSKLARSACGTRRTARAAARCEIAGVASPSAVISTPAPATDLRNARRSIAFAPLVSWHWMRVLTAKLPRNRDFFLIVGDREKASVRE